MKFDRKRYDLAVLVQRADRDAKRPFQPERLKQARQARGLSKGELMIACGGVPVGSIENERRAPTTEELGIIAKALRFPVHFFTNPPTKDGFILAPEWNTLDSHMAMRCPCGMDECGYWAPAGEELEPCKFGRKPPPCEWCKREAKILCDGKARYDRNDGKTCDRRMCARHRKRIGPHADVCPECAKKMIA